MASLSSPIPPDRDSMWDMPAEKEDSAMLHKAVEPLLDRGLYEDRSGHFFPPFDKQSEIVP